MKSMTGYGCGRCEVAGRRLIAEIRSVNHRFLDIKQRLPWSDPVVERELALTVRARVDRGAVTATVRDEGSVEVAPDVAANLPLARAYCRALEEVARACGLGQSEKPSLPVLAALPGIFTLGAAPMVGDELWQALAPGVERALDELAESRQREGAALAIDLRKRLGHLRSLVRDLGTLAAEAPEDAARRLRDRLARLLAPGEVDAQRLAQEVAILADRMDVTEELTRLAAHVDEVERLLAQAEPAGRRLDFFAQELHRELNTIGSKAQRAEIAQRVVDAKAEVERLREQVQNVE